MIWDKKNMNLEFNCACGSRVKKRNTFKMEHFISGNCAYECPSCKIVYDVWTKRNQRVFLIVMILLIMGIVITL